MDASIELSKLCKRKRVPLSSENNWEKQILWVSWLNTYFLGSNPIFTLILWSACELFLRKGFLYRLHDHYYRLENESLCLRRSNRIRTAIFSGWVFLNIVDYEINDYAFKREKEGGTIDIPNFSCWNSYPNSPQNMQVAMSFIVICTNIRLGQ